MAGRLRLEGKRIVVTAAAQGIGRASAEEFAKEGAIVFASDINKEKLEELKSVKNISTQCLDVTDTNAVQAYAQSVGKVDVLFNVCGFVNHGTVLECTDEIFDSAMNINVKSMFRMIRAFLPGMLQAGKGNIINMSSVASSRKGVPVRCIYQTTKAAVIGLTKSVAADYASKGIRCNCIQPGTINTPSLQGRISGNPAMSVEDSIKMFEARTPAGRFGRADEVAKLATFLASDDSDYINGGEHVIDGCWSL